MAAVKNVTSALMVSEHTPYDSDRGTQEKSNTINSTLMEDALDKESGFLDISRSIPLYPAAIVGGFCKEVQERQSFSGPQCTVSGS